MTPTYHHTAARRLAVAVLTVGAAVTLAACSSSGNALSSSSGVGSSTPGGMTGGMSSGMSMGGDSGSRSAKAGAPAPGPHNAADVTFATDMIPHHGQALEMAKLALAKATNPEVKQLAKAIEGAQTPEITTMTGWLKGWNQPVPDASMGGMDMGGMSMPGMMSSADTAKLKAATGAAFDRLWLTQMIAHHRGAVTMARTELSAGQNGDAKALAQSIIAGQSSEIDKMTKLLPTIT